MRLVRWPFAQGPLSPEAAGDSERDPGRLRGPVQFLLRPGWVSEAHDSAIGSVPRPAFGDTNLYLKRKHDVIELTAEHRNAAAIGPISLALMTDDDIPHLAVVAAAAAAKEAPAVEERILDILRRRMHPASQEEIRTDLKVRTQHAVAALRELERRGSVTRTRRGWTLASDISTKTG